MSENEENRAFMEELKEKFILTVNQNLSDIESLLNENKFKEIATIAHDLKGTSGLFGLDEGAVIAKQLQESAQKEDVEETKTWIDKLISYMQENNILKRG
jgi:HPt (histidine-containing phosphotransfer) domain-containing protein